MRAKTIQKFGSVIKVNKFCKRNIILLTIFKHSIILLVLQIVDHFYWVLFIWSNNYDFVSFEFVSSFIAIAAAFFIFIIDWNHAGIHLIISRELLNDLFTIFEYVLWFSLKKLVFTVDYSEHYTILILLIFCVVIPQSRRAIVLMGLNHVLVAHGRRKAVFYQLKSISRIEFENVRIKNVDWWQQKLYSVIL